MPAPTTKKMKVKGHVSVTLATDTAISRQNSPNKMRKKHPIMISSESNNKIGLQILSEAQKNIRLWGIMINQWWNCNDKLLAFRQQRYEMKTAKAS